MTKPDEFILGGHDVIEFSDVSQDQSLENIRQEVSICPSTLGL